MEKLDEIISRDLNVFEIEDAYCWDSDCDITIELKEKFAWKRAHSSWRSFSFWFKATNLSFCVDWVAETNEKLQQKETLMKIRSSGDASLTILVSRVIISMDEDICQIHVTR